MALPTLEKTWQYLVNEVVPGTTQTEDARSLVFKIKQLLTGFASNPWVVLRSSNSVAVADSDLWLTAANVVGNTTPNPHSWVVLKQAGLNGSNFQICIECNMSVLSQGSILMSPAAGFTGGSTTTRPTATDQTVFWNGADLFNLGTSGTTVTHALMSTDGQCTRLFTYKNGACILYFAFDTLADSPLPSKTAYTWVNAPTNLRANNLLSATYWHSYNGATKIYCYMGTECYNGIAVPAQGAGVMHNLVASYPMTPLSLHSETANNRGRAGRLVDIWMGSTAIPDGSTFPLSPPDREFILFAGYILPWNGVVPQIV